MRRQKAESVSPPSGVSLLRLMHILLALHASAIIALTYTHSTLVAERVFSILVASPMLLASFFSWFAATAKTCFGTSVFFCFFQALLFAGLPMMTSIFFPVHVFLFSLAAFYGLSALVLARYSFMQPSQKKN